ncbi:MAG: 3-phosphoserine/phosphohydroxythreonine transaminase [Streptococcaceae bacterium]|nr:3-phosphoserine/phosphohydroxythreonine transaminase [Streptococcaceae bacterium]
MTVYNFSAGPAVLPKPVLEQAQKEMLDYRGSGMSVMELSHRSSEFEEIINAAELRLRDLMAIPDNYRVLFLQGGASLQFSMVPLNLTQKKKKAYYIVAGSWGKKAYTEAVKLAKTIDFQPELLASSEATVFNHIPTIEAASIDPEAAYVHLTTNNTIEGTAIYDLPDTNGVPIVADMSSNILAVRYQVSDFGLIYAGAQKNIGPAGVTIVIVRDDLLNDSPVLSAMLDYRIQAENGSLYNTPPTYGIYIARLVFDYVASLGGVDKMEEKNVEKANLLYEFIDQSDFYRNPVSVKGDRSICNIPFVTPSDELDQLFNKEALAHGFKNIKGHRSVGGMRASIYNAFPLEGVQDLLAFMKEFEERNKG